MDVKNNSAGRLLDIFIEAKNSLPNLTVREAWADIFDVPADDIATILKLLADVITLNNETKRNLERLDNIDNKLYIKPFLKIESILSRVNLEGSWVTWQQQIDETTIYGLQICSDKLSRDANYTQIGEDEFESIKASLATLTDDILSSQLDTELKSLLIRNLERLRQALLAYKIKGIEGIEQEIELNIGSIVLNQEKIKQAKQTDKSNTIIKSYFVCLDLFNKTVSTAKSVKPFALSAMKALGID
ncbi:MAG: hypothetical protein Q9N62_04000 [Ghiorsea sp.]|nr:hypothetical protein [Ghiorsea sp.]